MSTIVPPPRSQTGRNRALPRALVATAAVTAGVVVTISGGVQLAADLVAVGLQAIFVAFFIRHLAFTLVAVHTAPVDLFAPGIDDPDMAPTVTVLVACKNEELVVGSLAASLVRLEYPPERLQIVVIDDGSVDATGELLAAAARRDPRIQCVNRPHDAVSGKAAALNDGLRAATGEIIVVFDADHRPRPDVLRRLVRHFKDPRVAAVQGRCEIHNGDASDLSRLVAIDYMTGYLINEYGRQSLFESPAYGGANCAVRASCLKAAGGWNAASVTEDTDLSVRLLLLGHRIRYDVTAVDREEGVVTLRRFWRQRYRWARGHQQVCRDYRARVWCSPKLNRCEKVEALMFLHVFHLPVASGLGLMLVAASMSGLVGHVKTLNLVLVWTLLFLGPLLEIGGGLVVGGARRGDALAIAYFLPLFLLSILLCTKAWVDAALGRRYEWVKTDRAAGTELLTA